MKLELQPRWVYGPVVHVVESTERPSPILRGEDDGVETQ